MGWKKDPSQSRKDAKKTDEGSRFTLVGLRSKTSLDGLQNKDRLLTGPTLTVAPEAISEYRISTNNFSAEYGGASGFIANVMSRSGGDSWHGVAYAYAKNDALDANDFQRNAAGLPRVPLKELESGGAVSGRVARGLFAAVSLD